MDVASNDRFRKHLWAFWLMVIAIGSILYTLKKSPFMFEFDMIIEHMVDMQELAEGNMIGHVVGEKSDYKTSSTIPEDIYNDLFLKQTGLYHFDHITDSEKKVYIEILWALSTFSDNIEVSTLKNEVISKCFQSVLNDHPEIFYVNGYLYTNHFLGDKLTKITISGFYTMDLKETKKYQARIDACVDQIFDYIPADADEYKKARYVYEYIIEHTEYDADADNNQNIISVFINNKSVCQGYAKSVQYLLQKLNMSATIIQGYVNGERHSWNLVSVNGNWYYMDATWGDASYYMHKLDDKYETDLSEINYDYLLVTTSFLEKTHCIDTVVDPPLCISSTDNFYVKEGLYFDVLDTESIRTAFEHGYENGWEMVTLKCSSPVVYEQMKMYLINNQEVFQYLHSDKDMISYIDNVSNNSVSFWL